ncbi:anaphase-promoting complex subunit 5-like [Sesamum indicum]|uniref:Anaphase-promoting complex subunit 5-like n=1 Tax=Sesamum indicum TaxID=4182 RepID=A0A8M8V2M5_SESIN|nr:anaphase-promoting complex subunit 5-like [Sesamum indicum]
MDWYLQLALQILQVYRMLHCILQAHPTFAVYKGYKDAFAAMRIAEKKFMCVSRSRILLVKLQVLHECALHRGHLKLA